MVAAMLIGALALVATGCGSKKGKYSASKTDYANAMNVVCKTINAKVKTIGISSLEDIKGQKGSDFLAAVDDALSSIDKLGTPPSEIKDAVAEYVSLQKANDDTFKKAIEAAKAGDTAKANEIGGTLGDNDAKLDAAANTIGAPACLSSAG